ncbi:Carboxylesterase YbfK [Streptomyces sp. enrichment culture]|uniref:alpha/beta fold hydrolase n=1 Tax=Streptomyces sp. enrichment culture TaxID=1795815 RepID=UPI003F565EB7
MSDRSTFFAAYDAVLRQWPVEVHGVDVPTPHGSTRVQVCGREDGTPVVLLPGGGTTSMAWYANVGALAPAHRVYAVDLMGDYGRSVHDGAPLRNAADLTAWLDALLDGLGLRRTHLCGHSYGAWIALNHALRSPHRLDRLVLLDPTQCFAGMSPRYLLRAVLTLLKPRAERPRAFHEWETGRAPEDPVWRTFLDATAFAKRSKVVPMPRPGAEALRACTVPTLVVLAGRSRAHDTPRVATAARRLLPEAEVAVLPDASHHSLPTERPAELNRLLAEFLA